ncbi:serine carboxypeptidase-like [Tripterygium wilfordii]|uniref:serine carboxypeptidase-like n=1 Tax=Tripterygium wilfordii TaxID=458696 RepID=UPI0018F7F467|nr:serine carboxypeptidase-like [Tripterygium wilfordii]
MVSTSANICLFLFLVDLFLTSSITEARYGEDNSSASHRPRLKLPSLHTGGPLFEHLCRYSGYFDLPDTGGARMFYFFFKSRIHKHDDPVVLWLSGGPGASSSMALFYENGPFRITEESSLIWNEYGWDTVSNIIYVDQPTGTGFSYSTDARDIRDNLTSVTNDLYNFLKKFFEEYRDFVRNDFFITGNSYAGHYVPALASKIQQENKKNEGLIIKLKGIAIGNGLTNAGIQLPTIPFFAKINGLITETKYSFIKEEMVPKCEESIKNCDMGDQIACERAYTDCNDIVQEIRNVAGNKNFFDIRVDRLGPLNYDYSKMESFLNTQSVQDALGVQHRTFVPWNFTIFRALQRDYVKRYDTKIPDLLKNKIKVLVYNGEKDLMCNWMGSFNWVTEMEWYDKEKFGEAPLAPFHVDGKTVGDRTNYGPLTFIKVLNAGHKVSMDQPKVAWQMLQNWMQQELE